MRSSRRGRPMVQRGLVLLFLFLFSFSIIPVPSVHAEKNTHVLRVGYPIQEGLTEIDSEGHYTGYTYEYLQELAQYTGWEYEFVQIPGEINDVLNTMLQMLRDGEIDLLGTMNYSEWLAQIFDYPSSSYGTVYSTLSVPLENATVNEANYQTLDPLRIAVLESASSGREKLEDFCNSNKMTPELIVCKDQQEMLDALREGRADAILGNDTDRIPSTRTVVRFSPQPMYFATTKGNTEIVNTLDNALTLLYESDPNFPTALYQKYFSTLDDRLLLNAAEEQFVAQLPPLKVAIQQERLPLDGYNSETGESTGISVDILSLISERAGIQFEPVPVASLSEAMEYLDQDKADLALGVIYDYVNAQQYHFSMTRPYISSQITMIVREGVDPYQLTGKKLALTKGLGYHGYFIGDVLWYDNMLECLEAVSKGDADYCYGNAYSIEYYYRSGHYHNLNLIPQSSFTNQYCIGVGHPADPILLAILNKAIRSITSDDLQPIVFENSSLPESEITLSSLIQSNPLAAMLVLFCVMLLLAGLLLWFAWIQKRARQKTQFENDRYQLLADISGEYLFEYDYYKDRLLLNDKTAAFFHTAPVHEHYFATRKNQDSSESQMIRTINKLAATQKSIQEEQEFVLSNGEQMWLRVTAASISDPNGNPCHIVGKVADILSEKQERDELSIRAQSDSLTGLYNCATVQSMAASALQEHAADGTLLIMDIDYFKTINDQYGHYTGDRVLQDVAHILRSVFRSEDIIGRPGGDEFMVYMNHSVSQEIAEEKCRSLLKAMEAHTDEWPQKITLSIGAVIADIPVSFDALYRLTDKILYQVKNTGRNSFQAVFYSKENPYFPLP